MRGTAGGATSPADAASGWGGDRVAWITGPNGANAAVLDTKWDTDADAAQFAEALSGYVAKLQAAGRSAAPAGAGRCEPSAVLGGNGDGAARGSPSSASAPFRAGFSARGALRY